jgi:hypothetical protein
MYWTTTSFDGRRPRLRPGLQEDITVALFNGDHLRPPYPFRAAEDGPPMTTTYGFDLARPRSRGARIARIDALATLLDTALVIPGTGVRFGLAECRVGGPSFSFSRLSCLSFSPLKGRSQ